jgi:hypothetical protein
MSLAAKVGENAAESRKRCGADRPAAHGFRCARGQRGPNWEWPNLEWPKWELPKWECPKWESPKWERPKWELAEWERPQAGIGLSGNGPKRERA